MLNKEDTDMAETKKIADQTPADTVEVLKTELEKAHKENSELREQNDQLRNTAQKLYQDNQTLRASLKAVTTLL